MSLKIFVYGTLKEKHCRGGVMKGQKLLGEVRTAPLYTLYSLTNFPGLVKSPEGKGKSIMGELWEIEEGLLPRLDAIEGHPNFYKREPVQIIGHEHEDIITYYFQKSTQNLEDVGECWNGA